MDDYMRGGGGGAGPLSAHHGGPMTTHYGSHQQHQVGQPRAHQVVKAATAVTAGGSLLLLSGLTLAGTVIALTIATPLLVIFSPVLVPAAITIMLLIGGFLASGGFGVAAVSVLAWIYRFMTGRHPMGADQLEHARMKLAGKARDVRDTAREHVGGVGVGGHHVGGGVHTATA